MLVIGSGPAGLSAAHLLSEKQWDVTMIERAPFLGGGLQTYYHGGHPYTFGPRHFLTEDERVFEFLNRYVPMRLIGHQHINLSYVEPDSRFYHWPMHHDDIEQMPDREQIAQELQAVGEASKAGNFEEHWIRSVGPILYRKFAQSYSKKMWRVDSNSELDGFEFAPEGVGTKPSVRIRTGPKAAWASPGVISAFPYKMNGYNDYFEIATQNTEVHLNTVIEAYDVENYRVKIEGEWRTYDIIVSTLSPDILLNSVFGELRYVGRDFMKIVLPVEEVFPPDVFFLYYPNDERFTRIVEYKKFYQYEAPTTLLGLEIPSSNGRFYPFPGQKDQATAQQYFDILPERVFSIGRNGTYRYGVSIAECIGQSMQLATDL